MIVLLVFVSGGLLSQIMVIKSPSSDSSYRTENKCSIEWNQKKGPQPDEVMMSLYPKGKEKQIAVIVRSTKNDGQHTWIIPANIPSGSYTIKIQSLNGATTFATSPVFRIIQSPPPDPCELAKNKQTDISCEDLMIISKDSRLATYTVKFKNNGPRCIQSIYLTVILRNRTVINKRVNADFWGTGRKWLLKGNESLIWQGTVSRSSVNPAASELEVKIGIKPFDRDLDRTVTNNFQTVVIRWE